MFRKCGHLSSSRITVGDVTLINVSAIQFSAEFMELWSYEIDLLAKFGNLCDLPCGLTVTRGKPDPFYVCTRVSIRNRNSFGLTDCLFT